MAGSALLVLRIGVAAAAVLVSERMCPCPSWTTFPLIVLIACMLLGFCARMAAGTCAAIILGAALETGGVSGLEISLHVASAIAVALLGAGAYSLDAIFFGRRVIHLSR